MFYCVCFVSLKLKLYCGFEGFVTFEDKRLQPQFESYEVTVTSPRIALQLQNFQISESLQVYTVQLSQPIVMERQMGKIVETVSKSSRQTTYGVKGQVQCSKISY